MRIAITKIGFEEINNNFPPSDLFSFSFSFFHLQPPFLNDSTSQVLGNSHKWTVIYFSPPAKHDSKFSTFCSFMSPLSNLTKILSREIV